jgi:hypothetical protein
MGIPILGANTADDTYSISNSVRFNDDDSAKLSRTFDSSGSRRKFTFSAWVKRGNLGQGYGDLFGTNLDSGESAGSKSLSIGFTSSNTFTIDSDTGAQLSLSTSRVFRDPSAWYHFVVAVDTTQSTASNRIKLYVNGVQETLTGNQPSQDLDTAMGRASEHTIGADYNSFFDGYMAEIYYVNDQQYDPTYFGKFDDNGVWVPVEPGTGAGGSITYGTNGFLLEFKQTGTSQNSSGIGADTSGQDNHFAVSNLAATDVTTDTPTNNFATLNPLGVTNADTLLSEGNTVHTVTNGNAWIGAYSTLGFASGKWYAEIKILDIDNTSFGIIQSGGDTVANINSDNSGYIGKYADGWGWWGNGTSAQLVNNNSNTNYGTQESVNDIFMIAVDVDGGKLWVGKNGTYFNAPGTSNAGDPAAGTNPGYSGITFTDFVHFASGNEAADGDDAATGWNFGNAAHSISSGNSDANGHGNFEYAVPSGFFALCTKNLAENG